MYNKFKVAPVAERTFNGIVYASKKEKNYRLRLEFLKLAVKKKEKVIAIVEQLPFDLVVNNHHICKYVLDFKVTYADNHVEYVDVKGYTKGTVYNLFKLKQRLMKAIYNIEVLER